MSTSAHHSVAELVKKFESLASAARSSSDNIMTGKRGGGGGGKALRVSKQQPRNCKDEQTLLVHVYDKRLKPSEHRGGGDDVVRYYDRYGIEYASPETYLAYHRRRYSLRDNVAGPATKMISSDVSDTTEIVDVVINILGNLN
ncbi:unnamed protein product [Aphis gossypii]|uniref:Uncharacterized protein n=1 Tax=Aphis gossypii TaxID=80765 RepID=A0A9P0IZU6_APHGO|nr:unnamed protein product [Aphis gossypii]